MIFTDTILMKIYKIAYVELLMRYGISSKYKVIQNNLKKNLKQFLGTVSK